MGYLINQSRRMYTNTPQSQPIFGKNQVKNNAGGYAFQISPWEQLQRFLVLGTEGGTYYVNEDKLTRDAATSVQKCLDENPIRAVDMIVEISDAGRAPKSDPVLFALAMASSHSNMLARKAAFAALPKVARTGTHLFHYAAYVDAMRGWGMGLRKAISSWYDDMPVDKLAYQVTKYQQRDGWSHRDLLRKTRPTPQDPEHNALYKYVTQGTVALEEDFSPSTTETKLYNYLLSVEEIKRVKDPKLAAKLITNFNLPREVVPTELLNSPLVWAALVERMPMTATIRNLGKLSQVGLLTPLSDAETTVISRLTNAEWLKKARVHPINILYAQRVYERGKGVKGSLSWSVNRRIVDALDEAYEQAFKTLEPTGKRHMLGLDVSGSMGTWGWGSHGNNGPFADVLTPRDICAAMALATSRIEPNTYTLAFTHVPCEIPWSQKARVQDVVKLMSKLDFGGTDCSLPMLYAAQVKMPVDVFVIYTDNETWFGEMHPVQALEQYRQKMGIDAKFVVVGITATDINIADPSDPGSLGIAGFDSSVPNILADFASEKLLGKFDKAATVV